MRSPSFSGISKHADFVLLDMVSLAIAFVVSYYLKFGDLGFIDSSTWRGLFVLLIGVSFAVTLLSNPYSGIFRRRYWEDIGTELKIALESFLIICVIFYLFKIGEDYSREMLVVTYAIYVVLALLLKYVHKRRMLSRWSNRPEDSVRRLILVSDGVDPLQEQEFAYADDIKASSVVGFCLTGDEVPPWVGDKPAVPVEDITKLCASTNADEVLLLVNPAKIDEALLEELIDNGIKVRLAIHESIGISSEVQTIGQVGVFKTLDLERHSFGASQALYLPLKRIVDIIIGAMGCLVTIPLAAIVKVSYLVQGDAHPIFYRQTRIGKRGKPFQMWKLRSMVWNADEILEELLEDPEKRAEWGRDQKLDDDPRITPVGRILRRTSLDELPQFFNIFKGDMSVVGPRPLVEGELEDHGGRQLYNKVKPGLTGWWGCNGRSNIEYYERLELEYYYVTHCSLYLDALCIFRTIVAVFKKEGAQ